MEDRIPKSNASTTRAQEAIEAEYATLKRAEEAVSALEWAGIDPANVVVGGPAVQHAEAQTDTELRDTRIFKDVGGHALTGIVIGGATGFIVGGVAALVASSVVWGAGGREMWLATGLGALIGAIVGGILGAILGGETALNINDTAELKYEDVPPERAFVRVTLEDSQNSERVTTILEAKQPVRVQRLGGGRPRPA
jgi:hypothetical protein